MAYTVGEVAALSGTTVRTLHHYEQVGLLVPGRAGAGYRSYSAADLDRLTRILYYRELDVPLNEVGALLDDPVAGGADHLRRHRDLVRQRLSRLAELLCAIERELEAVSMGTELTPEEKLEVFGADYDPSWEAEAEARWGDTDIWKVATEKQKSLTKEDWKRIKADGDALMVRLADAADRGVDPASEEAAELAELHRRGVEVFYPCSYAQQCTLADMYLADERFARTYDDLATGLAQWVHDAIHANAARHS